jgi:beta-alanine--pyruvate transaminase
MSSAQAGMQTAPNDLESFWMPFTANRQFKRDPRMLVAAKDMHYRSADGRLVLDGTAGLWCVNAGHARPRIVEAVQHQIAELDYAPVFNIGHPKAFELAGRLAAIAPQGLSRVFFTNSGSESVDTALKIALAYHRASGRGERVRLIGRERGYHGVGFGGISVGGIVSNRNVFGTLLSGTDHIRHTHDLKRNAFSRGQPEYGAEFADDFERVIALHDAATIAAVIVEPVAGSTGVLVPPKGYLERLRAICDKHGILLIFDEVITGFGRLGPAFAADYFGVTPDIMVTAKGITNGSIPMGAVFVRDAIYDAFMQAAPGDRIELFHGYTYSGHPVASAAGLATLDTYKEEELFSRSVASAPYWAEALHDRLTDCPYVIDIRNLGLMGAIELEPLPGQPGLRASTAFRRAFDAGILVRTTGDVIALSPPLIISRPQIDELIDKLRTVLLNLD